MKLAIEDPRNARRGEELLGGSAATEPQAMAAKTDPASSPSSLRAPYFAGGVQQVQHPMNDDPWEEEMESYMDHEDTQTSARWTKDALQKLKPSHRGGCWTRGDSKVAEDGGCELCEAEDTDGPEIFGDLH